jgi:hypothetical protein
MDLTAALKIFETASIHAAGHVQKISEVSSRTSSCRPSPPNSREKSGLSSDSGTDFIRSGSLSEEVAMGAHPGRILPLLKACGDEEKNEGFNSLCKGKVHFLIASSTPTSKPFRFPDISRLKPKRDGDLGGLAELYQTAHPGNHTLDSPHPDPSEHPT